jgi:hypothetical protein
VTRIEPIVGDLPQVRSAQARIVEARILVRGATAVGDMTAFHAARTVRGQLLRAATLLDRSADLGHWLAGDHRRGAAEARRAARMVGQALRMHASLDPYDGLTLLLSRYRAASTSIERAFRAAYAGTHP